MQKEFDRKSGRGRILYILLLYEYYLEEAHRLTEGFYRGYLINYTILILKASTELYRTVTTHLRKL